MRGDTPHLPSHQKRKLKKTLIHLKLNFFVTNHEERYPPHPSLQHPTKTPHPTPASHTLNPSNRFYGQVYKKERGHRIFVACIVEVKAPGVLFFSSFFQSFFRNMPNNKRKFSTNLPSRRRRTSRRRNEELGEPSETSTSTTVAANTAPSSSTTTSAATNTAPSSSTATSAASSSADNLQRITIPPPMQRLSNRPPPIEGECLVCFEGHSAPPTVCCGKPMCNDCLIRWMNERRIFTS